MSCKATSFIAVRHGETEWNVCGRIQGQGGNPGLNSEGRQQIQTLAATLSKELVHAIYSSDLLRARDSAEIIASQLGLPVILQPGLRERSAGVLEGLTAYEAKQTFPEAWQILASKDSKAKVPGGGESLEEVQQRVVATIEAIHSEHQGETVVIVMHGGALHAVHRHVANYSYKAPFVNASLSRFKVEGKKWGIEAWNICAHLSGVCVLQAGTGGDARGG